MNAMPIAIDSTVGECCMYQRPKKHEVHAPIERDAREIEWLNLRPLSAEKAPIKQQGFVAPLGALEGLDHFVARVEALKRLTTQQERDAATNRILIEADKELPTIVDEFRANGFKAMSMSSSQNDDDIESANLAAKHLGFVPYDPDPETIAPLMRRIEWEKEQALSGPCLTMQAIKMADGSWGAQFTAKWMETVETFVSPSPISTMQAMAERLILHSGLSDEAIEGRERAHFYGVVGSILYGKMKGAQWPEQTMDDLGAEEQAKPEPADAGPVEIGLHGGASDDVNVIMRPNGEMWLSYEMPIHEGDVYEPSPVILWPEFAEAV